MAAVKFETVNMWPISSTATPMIVLRHCSTASASLLEKPHAIPSFKLNALQQATLRPPQLYQLHSVSLLLQGGSPIEQYLDILDNIL